MIRTLDGVIETPVDPVDIDVQKALVRSDVAHGEHGLPAEGIANIKRIIAGAAPLPAVIGVGPEHDGVKSIGSIISKERVAKL